MEGGSTSEPWTCERGMKEHASERGLFDKVRPVTSREVVPKRYAFSSRISSISFVCVSVTKRPKRTEPESALEFGTKLGGFENATRRPRQQGAQRHVSVRNWRKPPITEKLRLRRRLLMRKRRRSSATSADPVSVSAFGEPRRRWRFPGRRVDEALSEVRRAFS